MANRAHRLRRLALAAGALLVVALALLHARYPLPYVYRVLVHQDADFDDIHRFPARVIAPPPAARPLAPAAGASAAEALARHPRVGDLDALLAATETTAFIVLHRGRLIAERYRGGHHRASPQNTFSVSKSVASLVVGLAVRDGHLELAAPITRYLPELGRRDRRFGDVTVGHLLDMRSGIRYRPGVDPPFVDADDALIYYHPDLASLLLRRLAVAGPPGGFQYNNYNPPLLGLILTRRLEASLSEYLERELWRPLGAEGAAGWMVDGRGLERMESGFFARARDLARLGQLVLDRGRVEGREVVPEAWIEATTELTGPSGLDSYDGRSWVYRMGWWIVPRGEGAADLCAIGRYGQFVYVSPRFDAVFVRTGPGRGAWGDRDWTELFYRTAERLATPAAPSRTEVVPGGDPQAEPRTKSSTVRAG